VSLADDQYNITHIELIADGIAIDGVKITVAELVQIVILTTHKSIE